MAEKKEKLDFEKALENLEGVVEALEGGSLTLDQALKRYEEGVGLIRACQAKLTETEKRIEVLTKNLDGSLKREVFAAEAVARGAVKGKRPPPFPPGKNQTRSLRISTAWIHDLMVLHGQRTG